MSWKAFLRRYWFRPRSPRPYRTPRPSRPRRPYRPEFECLQDRILPTIGTTTSLSISASEVVYGQPVTVTAGLSADNGTAPAATVHIAGLGDVSVNDGSGVPLPEMFAVLSV